MSIVELSQSVGALAKLVAEKSRELDDLKQSYNQKILTLNRYLENLPQERFNQSQGLDENEFINTLSTPVKCSQCHSTVYENSLSSDYALIPKRALQPVVQTKSRSTPESIISSKLDHLSIENNSSLDPKEEGSSGVYRAPHRTHSVQSDTSNTQVKIQPQRHSNSKSKKICSYCNKAGHSRARCMIRLSTPAPGDI